MIELKIGGEQPTPPDRVVEFTFRRHEMASTNKPDAQVAFLVGRELTGPGPILTKCYPIKVDGRRQQVTVRRRDFEKLGFTVVVED